MAPLLNHCSVLSPLIKFIKGKLLNSARQGKESLDHNIFEMLICSDCGIVGSRSVVQIDLMKLKFSVLIRIVIKTKKELPEKPEQFLSPGF